MSSGVETRSSGALRLGSGGNGSMVSEFMTGGKSSVGRSFLQFLLLSSHLHPSSLLWISARYKWRRHGFHLLRISVNGRWSFPLRRICRKVTLSGTDWLWDFRVHTIAYVRWLFYSLFPFSSFLLFIPLCFLGSRPSTNGIATGLYHLRITAKWRWSFPLCYIQRKATVRCQLVARHSSLYEYVCSMIVQCFLSFSLVWCMQPRRSAPKERDNVTAACDPGRVPAILHSRLATRLRSLAIILPTHIHLLSLKSTFATVFLYFPYIYLWGRTQAYVPLQSVAV